MSDEADNRKLFFSSKGRAELTRHEGLKKHYYNDPTNCTYGIGTLVHFGPCTPEELNAPVTDEQINGSLNDAVRDAERTIKNKVTKQQLTQDQYDALVSFVYNRGAGNSKKVLELANKGDFKGVAHYMNRVVYMKVVDKKTGKATMQQMPGLVSRRKNESLPFKEVKK